MENSVVIKSNPYGIVVILDDKLPFDELTKEVIKKFKSSEKFFKNASLAISFEGRELRQEQQIKLLDAITENSSLNIVCIVDNDEYKKELFRKKTEELTEEYAQSNGLFYKGTLRSGQVLESEKSIVIIGDVNPGAKIISKGNIIVIGSLKGTVYAGASENKDAYVIALEMSPVQIKIGEVIARSSDDNGNFVSKKRNKKQSAPETMIAYVKDNMIYIEPMNRKR